ncbi:NAD-dependent epimerase/dehydratase family protein [Burkholderia ambifaria]|uniref:NAD-dependent epimerase/dehydratase family protein n=1 Tax=Burkholderia ambifaria TaxID=152480 RepID=UPI001B986C41|nr:NAD(P)-dependent oxidoreductase [Burkholderia ambifaria]MBR8257579.1 NAD(P)-dependent oxidoreductase [Burkholderia ambifaria]
MASIAVTGAGGWLGVAVVRALAARGDTVHAFDLEVGDVLATIAADSEKKGGRVVASGLDIRDAAAVRAALTGARPDAIIHCAAVVGVIAAESAPVVALRVNVEGTVNVLEAMRENGIRRMIHLSTEETYGDFQTPVIDENHPQQPESVYGLTKQMAEQFCRYYQKKHGLECIHLRTCWVYGPHLPRARVPKTFIDAALAGEPYHLESGGDLEVDQVYIDDTVAGVLLALDKPVHRFDSYHIATGAAPSIRDVAEIVNHAVPGARITAADGPYLNGGIRCAKKGALDIHRARTELGYEPRYDIQRGIEATIDATRAENQHRAAQQASGKPT